MVEVDTTIHSAINHTFSGEWAESQFLIAGKGGIVVGHFTSVVVEQPYFARQLNACHVITLKHFVECAQWQLCREAVASHIVYFHTESLKLTNLAHIAHAHKSIDVLLSVDFLQCLDCRGIARPTFSRFHTFVKHLLRVARQLRLCHCRSGNNKCK